MNSFIGYSFIVVILIEYIIHVNTQCIQLWGVCSKHDDCCSNYCRTRRGISYGNCVYYRRRVAITTTSTTAAPYKDFQASDLDDKENCGKRYKTFLGTKVVGGVKAERGEFPWIVSILQRANGEGDAFHFCGGSIIDHLHIVTAAHCFYGKTFTGDNIVILAGVLNVEKEKNYLPIDKIVNHEKFKRSNFDNDITIIKLRQPLEFNNYIRPICLPGYREAIPHGDTVYVAGWGLTEENGLGSDDLLKTSVPAVSRRRCYRRYPQITSNLFCAGIGQNDSCRGDSGGPLTKFYDVRGYQQGYLYGIVSNGAGCARADAPGVYTRVTNYINWIKDTIAKIG